MWWAILASSLVGSVHCIAMCGPLVGLAGSARLHALGRLTTYVVLGTAAGFAGSALDLAGRLATVQHAATLATGAALLGWGVWQLAIALGWQRFRVRGGTAYARGLVQIRTRSAARRAYVIGLLTGLLPCGWLWAFVLSAAGTGSPLAGAAAMGLFWLGTAPAMIGLLGLARPVVRRIQGRMPLVTAGVLLVLGTATLALRWRDAGEGGVTHPHCHEVAR
ncbi:MAG TPA: sulfite exporter TauE/SafE family protein [Kofleriaceae bacterium]|jgi:hypothetical protein